MRPSSLLSPKTAAQLTALLLLGAALLALGLAIGSMGWSPWTESSDTMRMTYSTIFGRARPTGD